MNRFSSTIEWIVAYFLMPKKFRPKLDYLGTLIIIIFASLLIIGLFGLQIYASYQCGWANSLLYGKMTFWAWLTGYCS